MSWTFFIELYHQSEAFGIEQVLSFILKECDFFVFLKFDILSLKFLSKGP